MCQIRWGIGRPRAYQRIDAAGVIASVSTAVDMLPTTERQACALARLPAALQGPAWACALESVRLPAAAGLRLLRT